MRLTNLSSAQRAILSASCVRQAAFRKQGRHSWNNAWHQADFFDKIPPEANRAPQLPPVTLPSISSGFDNYLKFNPQRWLPNVAWPNYARQNRDGASVDSRVVLRILESPDFNEKQKNFLHILFTSPRNCLRPLTFLFAAQQFVQLRPVIEKLLPFTTEPHVWRKYNRVCAEVMSDQQYAGRYNYQTIPKELSDAFALLNIDPKQAQADPQNADWYIMQKMGDWLCEHPLWVGEMDSVSQANDETRIDFFVDLCELWLHKHGELPAAWQEKLLEPNIIIIWSKQTPRLEFTGAVGGHNMRPAFRAVSSSTVRIKYEANVTMICKSILQMRRLAFEERRQPFRYETWKAQVVADVEHFLGPRGLHWVSQHKHLISYVSENPVSHKELMNVLGKIKSNTDACLLFGSILARCYPEGLYLWSNDLWPVSRMQNVTEGEIDLAQMQQRQHDFVEQLDWDAHNLFALLNLPVFTAKYVLRRAEEETNFDVIAPAILGGLKWLGEEFHLANANQSDIVRAAHICLRDLGITSYPSLDQVKELVTFFIRLGVFPDAHESVRKRVVVPSTKIWQELAAELPKVPPKPTATYSRQLKILPDNESKTWGLTLRFLKDLNHGLYDLKREQAPMEPSFDGALRPHNEEMPLGDLDGKAVFAVEVRSSRSLPEFLVYHMSVNMIGAPYLDPTAELDNPIGYADVVVSTLPGQEKAWKSYGTLRPLNSWVAKRSVRPQGISVEYKDSSFERHYFRYSEYEDYLKSYPSDAPERRLEVSPKLLAPFLMARKPWWYDEVLEHVQALFEKDFGYVLNPGEDLLHRQFVATWNAAVPNAADAYLAHITDTRRLPPGKKIVGQCQEKMFLATQIFRYYGMPCVYGYGLPVQEKSNNENQHIKQGITTIPHANPLLLALNAHNRPLLEYVELPSATFKIEDGHWVEVKDAALPLPPARRRMKKKNALAQAKADEAAKNKQLERNTVAAKVPAEQQGLTAPSNLAWSLSALILAGLHSFWSWLTSAQQVEPEPLKEQKKILPEADPKPAPKPKPQPIVPEPEPEPLLTLPITDWQLPGRQGRAAYQTYRFIRTCHRLYQKQTGDPVLNQQVLTDVSERNFDLTNLDEALDHFIWFEFWQFGFVRRESEMEKMVKHFAPEKMRAINAGYAADVAAKLDFIRQELAQTQNVSAAVRALITSFLVHTQAQLAEYGRITATN